MSLVLLASLAGSATNRTLFVLLNLTMLGDGAVALALVLPSIRRSPRCFWAALIAAVFAALWVQVLKQVVSVPRPLAVLAPALFFQSGPAYRAVSFPSVHAAASFAIAGIWIMALPGRTVLRMTLLVLAALVSLSRVMVGVHWPSDILWGMLGGWLGAWAGLALYARYQWSSTSPAASSPGWCCCWSRRRCWSATMCGFRPCCPCSAPWALFAWRGARARCSCCCRA
jgi:membrane-associated phospholipid phosphatase